MVTIRKTRKKDFQAILDLYQQRNDKSTNFIDITQSCLEKYLNKPQIVLITAVEKEKIVGFCLTFDMVLWGYIDTLIITKKHRRKGIGTKIINYLKKFNDDWVSLETAILTYDSEVKVWVTSQGFRGKDYLTWKILKLDETFFQK